MVFAAIYVPDFPVQAMVRAEPELREQAVAVIEGAPPLGRVIAVNERAAQAVVDVGITKLQCEERLRAACGDRGWEVRQRSAEREAAAHAALLDAACAFSPRVEDTAVDTIVLDLSGLERIFGPPARIAREVARRCSEIGLEANVGIAGNPDAAVHAARGFEGVTVIAPGKEAERLGTLPVEVLCSTVTVGSAGACPERSERVSPAVARAPRSRRKLPETVSSSQELMEKFERWGVRTFRALAALPEVAVVERLGQQGLQLQRLARGAVERTLVPVEPPLSFEESMELEYPIELLEPLAFVLSRMLEQLCARLAMRALATNELSLRLELEAVPDDECGQWPVASGQQISEFRFAISNLPGDDKKPFPQCIGPSSDSCPHQDDTRGNQKSEIRNHHSGPAGHRPLTTGHFERTLRLPVPMCDAKVFLKLWQLELKTNPPSAPVVKVWLRAEPVQPRVAQQGLFAPASPQAERLEVTLKRIERVVKSGPQVRRVGSAEVLDTHRPDAFAMQRFEVSGQSSVASGQQSPDSALDTPHSALTALRVFRPPLRVAVTMKDERPVTLACAERPTLRGDVTWCAGPWRASGEWWESGQWSVASGQQFPQGLKPEFSERLNGTAEAVPSPQASTAEVASARPSLTSVPLPIPDTRGLIPIASDNHKSQITNRKFPGWAREEWDIAVHNEDGTTLYRLYYDVAQRAWFLFGIYD